VYCAVPFKAVVVRCSCSCNWTPLYGVVVLCLLHSSFTFLNDTQHNHTIMNSTTSTPPSPANLPPQAKRVHPLNSAHKDLRHKSAPAPAMQTDSFLLVFSPSWGRPHTKWAMWDATRGGWERSWYKLKDDKITEQPETPLKRAARAHRVGMRWWQW